MSKDSLGDRQKGYENVFRAHLPARMPVIIRVDGCHFHTYTRGCQRPFDERLVHVMNETAIYLCKNIQGAQLAYTQSDEISILLNNYQSTNTQPWFNNNVQKMTSVSAAMASAYFSSLSHTIFGQMKLATFDSRVFVIPKEDVNNYFLWRQKDMERNSIQMLARSLYSQKQLINKKSPELQELCWQKGKNWNDLPTSQKRGRCIIKRTVSKPTIYCDNSTGDVMNVERSVWLVDNEIPIFSQDKNYINQYI